MQSLCQLDVLGDEFLEDLDGFLADEQPGEPIQAYARGLVREIWMDRARLDERIQSVSEHWDMGRMAPIDRNTIRIAAHELLRRDDVPPRVTINEAIEIGKSFGTAESGKFINGVLDALRKQMESPTAPSNPRTETADGTV